MKTLFLTLACTLAICVSGCSREPATAVTQITGTIEYRTPVNFESGATLDLRLTDVSGDDAVEIASAT
jgi:uncharacterized lipoprotein YbaY